MALSINWLTRVITVPQADLTLIAGTRYRLDVDAFRLALKDLEDSEEGMSMPDTHSHATQRTLSGVTYARQLEIINGYTVTFQDVGTPYRVECVGANHNIADVQNTNNVSLVIGNSAGLIVVETGTSGLTPAETALLNRIADIPTTLELFADPIPVNIKKVNDVTIRGTGSYPSDPWGPA